MDGSVRKLFVPLLMNQGPSNLAFTFYEIPDEGHGYVSIQGVLRRPLGHVR
jgi:hypothetical protein